jgi:hypothetical protein
LYHGRRGGAASPIERIPAHIGGLLRVGPHVVAERGPEVMGRSGRRLDVLPSRRPTPWISCSLGSGAYVPRLSCSPVFP